MSPSISEMLKAAEQARRPAVELPPEAVLHRVCVCGHLESRHSTAIGGAAFEIVKDLNQSHRRFRQKDVLLGCNGEPRPPKSEQEIYLSDPMDQDSWPEDPDQPERKMLVKQLVCHCPCTSFRPVIAVYDPRRAFFARRPVDPPRSGKRDRNPDRHPVIQGIRAIRSFCSGRKEIEAMRKAEVEEDEIETAIEAMLNERVRWLPDGQRCWVGGCSTGELVLPYYVDESDLSEMRCLTHRP